MVKKPVPSTSDSLVSSAPVAKKRSISKVLDVSADIPLRGDGSIDILEILKTAVRDFDQGIISLGLEMRSVIRGFGSSVNLSGLAPSG